MFPLFISFYFFSKYFHQLQTTTLASHEIGFGKEYKLILHSIMLRCLNEFQSIFFFFGLVSEKHKNQINNNSKEAMPQIQLGFCLSPVLV